MGGGGAASTPRGQTLINLLALAVPVGAVITLADDGDGGTISTTQTGSGSPGGSGNGNGGENMDDMDDMNPMRTPGEIGILAEITSGSNDDLLTSSFHSANGVDDGSAGNLMDRGIRRVTNTDTTPNTFDVIVGTRETDGTTTYRFASGDDAGTGQIISDNNNLAIRDFYTGATDSRAYMIYSGTNVDGEGTGNTAITHVDYFYNGDSSASTQPSGSVTYSGDYIIAAVPAAGQTATQAFENSHSGTFSFDMDFAASFGSDPISNGIMMDSAATPAQSGTFGTAIVTGRILVGIDFAFEGTLANFGTTTLTGVFLGANFQDFFTGGQIAESVTGTDTMHVIGMAASRCPENNRNC